MVFSLLAAIVFAFAAGADDDQVLNQPIVEVLSTLYLFQVLASCSCGVC